MKVRAIIFGATGMVGEGVLRICLQHPDVESVLVVGRRSCGLQHSKLREILHNDFFDYSAIESQMRGYNACYFCLGVTSLGKSEAEYTKLTYNLTMQAARALARVNPAITFCYVSGEGTDSTERGRLMWARVKGKTENDLTKLFASSYAFRPGFIKPLDGQTNAHGASKVVGTFYPLLRSFLAKHVCTLEDLGMAMIRATRSGYEKKIFENEDIARFARSAAE